MQPNFMAFTTKFSGLTDRLITPIEVFPAFDPSLSADPAPTGVQTTALWDTGATRTMIMRAVAERLGLIPAGTARIRHVNGEGTVNTYVVNVGLPNSVMVPGVVAAECAETAGDFGVLVGMNIITLGDFAVTNRDSATWVTYRYPSVSRVDYVDEANRVRFAGVRRNDPCPCGRCDENGKPIKFKYCHGSKVPVAV